MANEKRLIDANALMDAFRSYMVERYDKEKCISEENCKTCEKSCLWRKIVSIAPTVDAVEVEKYNRLLGMYNELRENFVDFVCSGIPNVAPYCLNRCDGCCDAYGWCKRSTLCQGFDPAEVILDGERKDNGTNYVKQDS